MPKPIENPFKERRMKWARYLTVSLSCLAVLGLSGYLFFSSDDDNAASSSYKNFRRTEQQGVSAAKGKNNKDFHSIEIVQQQQQQLRRDGDDAEDEDESEDEDEPEVSEEADIDKDGAYNEEEWEGMKNFKETTLSEYPKWLNNYYMKLVFDEHPPEQRQDKLTRTILQKSLTMGCDNMVANMRDEGNFNYQYDFVEKELDSDDMAVRQAGALWGLAMCWQHDPRNKVWQTAVEKGIKFYKRHMEPGPSGQFINYPGEESSESGANALFGLALIEYLRTVRDTQIAVDSAQVKDVEDLLRSIISFLLYLQNDDLHFSFGYYMESEEKSEKSSPYYDGETMLCLTKAAKYIDGYSYLIPIIEKAAPIMAKAYTVDEWKKEPDSDETKGFYQWSSMLFTEYYEAQWKDYEVFGDYVIVLGHWILHTHEVLRRKKNTGYAFEGIISAHEVAKARGHTAALNEFKYAIDEGLYKLTQWQPGGPLSHKNSFLQKNPTDEKFAIGGIMNGKNDPTIRIDTTQHQMHSVMLALSFVYKE